MGPRPRILVLDGAHDLREIVTHLLEAELGFEVASCSSLDAAIDQLNERDFAFVLTAYESGWESLERLRKAAAPAGVGVLTGWNLDPAEVSRRGFAFIFRKPFDLDALASALASNIKVLAPSPEQQAVVRAYFKALSDKDWAALGRLCTEDVRYQAPGSHERWSAEVVGRAEFERFSAETFKHFPLAKFEVDEVLGLPLAVVGRYTSEWPGPDGKPVRLKGAVVFRFAADNRISEIGIRLALRKLDASAQT